MPGKRASEDVRREQILQAAFEVASRDGVASLTIRGVAAEAGISHALVLFHFQRKERLVHALLQQEMARLSHQPRHTRLFFDFWALGVRDETLRTRMSAELERYRAAFRVLMEELLLAEPTTFHGASADGLAAVAVSWIQGCAVQAMMDPEHFDTDEYLAAVRGMVRQLA